MIAHFHYICISTFVGFDQVDCFKGDVGGGWITHLVASCLFRVVIK